jgi:hypothetical protein
MGRGQKERELWQGEGSGLGTLTLEPPPQPPLMNSLNLLALPLLGGMAGGFFRRAGVQGLASGLPGRLGLLLGLHLAFDRSWTEVRPRTEGAGLIWPSPVRYQGLLNPGIVAKEMSQGRGTQLQGRTLAIFPRPLRMSTRSPLESLRTWRRESTSCGESPEMASLRRNMRIDSHPAMRKQAHRI